MRVDPHDASRAASDAGPRAMSGPILSASDRPPAADLETVWPEPVAVGETVQFRARAYRVVRSEPRRVACDDPDIFGAHLDGAEGAVGALVGLVAVPRSAG